MRKGIRITIFAVILCLLAIGLFAVYSLNESKRRELTCAGVKVEFADSFRFVTSKDIESYLKKDYGAFIGQRLDSVDLKKVEKILNSKSAVLKTEAYTTPDGFLNVKIYQREPVARFQKGGFGFYADERGFLFPLQSNYTSQVMIIDGNIPLSVPDGYKGEPKTEAEKKWLAGVLELLDYMRASKSWSGFFGQISVNQNGDLLMIPRAGKERFIFGEPDEIDSKFKRIGEYYTTVAPDKEPGFYSSVNVKYNRQIVCRK